MAQADQIEIVIPKTTWQEGSAFIAVAYFRLRSTASGVTPTTARYRIDGLSTGTTILDWTSLTPATSNSISITGAQNKIQNDRLRGETKQLTVEADNGLDTQYRAKITWRVNNLYGIV